MQGTQVRGHSLRPRRRRGGGGAAKPHACGWPDNKASHASSAVAGGAGLACPVGAIKVFSFLGVFLSLFWYLLRPCGCAEGSSARGVRHHAWHLRHHAWQLSPIIMRQRRRSAHADGSRRSRPPGMHPHIRQVAISRPSVAAHQHVPTSWPSCGNPSARRRLGKGGNCCGRVCRTPQQPPGKAHGGQRACMHIDSSAQRCEYRSNHSDDSGGIW